MKRGLVVLLGLMGFVALGGCGLFGNGDENGDAGNGDGDGNGDGGPLSRLELITEPEPTVTFGQQVPMQVRYLDPSDVPIPDTFVSFEVSGDSADTVISERNALTNADGVAETQITGGNQEVDFDVVISVPSDDTVAPITVHVRVQPKDSADYIVRVSYDGPVTLGQVDVYLYDVDRACDTLTPGWEPGAPSPDVAWNQLQILPDAEGNIPDRELNVPADVQLSYAVARASASDGQGGSTSYLVTFGCKDQIPPLEQGSPVAVEITLQNLWPEIEGTYRVESELDLLGLIPDNAGDIHGPVGELFSKPSEGVLRLIALAVDGEDYYNASPWDTLFTLCVGAGDPLATCQEADQVVLNARGESLAALIEWLVDQAVAAQPGSAGETLNEALQVGADIFENAERFAMGGDLVIGADPDDSGLLGENNRIAYNQISWLWSGSQRTIGLREEFLVQSAQISGALVFHPLDAEVYSLVLSPHELSLSYGEILIWVLEGIVFPEVFGPEVDSFEAFFNTLVDCEELSNLVAPNYGDAVASALEAGCGILQLSALDALHAWIAGLASDLQTWYQVSTPEGDPCRMSLESGRERFSIEALGSEIPCRWTGELRAEGAEPEPLDGVWWGERL